MTDDPSHLERVRSVLRGQLAPEAAEGGRRILLRCPSCRQPWLMDGPHSFPRLELEQLARLATELQADLHNLPIATCPVCGATQLGEISIDSYGNAEGFGVSWESPSPPTAHLIGSALRLDWLERQRLRRHPEHAQVVTDFVKCRAFLGWLAHVHSPMQYQPMDKRGSDEMARLNKPGHGVPGTENWLWKGATWQENIRALGGRCYVNLCMAMPADAPFDLAIMLATWRELASVIAGGHITGEPDVPPSWK